MNKLEDAALKWAWADLLVRKTSNAAFATRGPRPMHDAFSGDIRQAENDEWVARERFLEVARALLPKDKR